MRSSSAALGAFGTTFVSHRRRRTVRGANVSHLYSRLCAATFRLACSELKNQNYRQGRFPLRSVFPLVPGLFHPSTPSATVLPLVSHCSRQLYIFSVFQLLTLAISLRVLSPTTVIEFGSIWWIIRYQFIVPS
ncbi:uncharacterized protein LOC107629911 [Arachis ipaensis]|uniref:uncharacterized protein LOC107629911 n=1 Tax=Arachis ipaensis TaxID=130454 RepID=UPI0007AF2E07|nr:uncharacterized protein LOC107629911 [Arachis ipaensis]